MIGYLEKFDMKNTFENGQCFRWNNVDDKYIGVAFDEVVVLKYVDNKIEIKTSGNKDISFWENYFFLDKKSKEIDEQIKSIDINLEKSFKFGKGMKILRQEPFEMLISFITSSNNNIKRIKMLVEKLSKNYGKEVILDNVKHYTFPKPMDLANVKIEEYREMGFGYRDKYIYDAVQSVINNKINLEEIHFMDRDEAIKELTKVKGVGKKVASCISLFAYSKYNSFPVDVWIKKVLEKMYKNELKKYENVDDFIDEYFGEYSGVAQQYLFYYARENKI